MVFEWGKVHERRGAAWDVRPSGAEKSGLRRGGRLVDGLALLPPMCEVESSWCAARLRMQRLRIVDRASYKRDGTRRPYPRVHHSNQRHDKATRAHAPSQFAETREGSVESRGRLEKGHASSFHRLYLSGRDGLPFSATTVHEESLRGGAAQAWVFVCPIHARIGEVLLVLAPQGICSGSRPLGTEDEGSTYAVSQLRRRIGGGHRSGLLATGSLREARSEPVLSDGCVLVS